MQKSKHMLKNLSNGNASMSQCSNTKFSVDSRSLCLLLPAVQFEHFDEVGELWI
jgi:hypothetical protein